MLCYELLQSAQTIDSALGCQKLMEMKQTIEKKTARTDQEKVIVFHQDKATSTLLWRLDKNWDSLALKF